MYIYYGMSTMYEQTDKWVHVVHDCSNIARARVAALYHSQWVRWFRNASGVGMLDMWVGWICV